MTLLTRNPFVWNLKARKYFEENNSPRVEELWAVADTKNRAKVWVWIKNKVKKLDPLGDILNE